MADENENKITWVDNDSGEHFYSEGTHDDGIFIIEYQNAETGYGLSHAEGQIPNNGDMSGFDFTMVAGGEGEDKNWATHSAKLRASKMITEGFPVGTDADSNADSTAASAGTGGAQGSGGAQNAGASDSTQNAPPHGTGHNGVNQEQLRAFVERIERLQTEKNDINEGINDVYAEAQAYGYHKKSIRECIKLRKKDPEKLAEEEAQLNLYKELLLI